ncbi:MAG: family 20 glycosylhydrolase [Flavobacterium sp.]|uniref:family 20 glycosylhydrolase n=1 Tax=Flavobacterium sp. TaxID=239 RepID=UPI00260BD670|nr:family 20 glycosylhydrolase [Flavobacterium sp.]MDD5150580.1 family 20 glycosylhydrolase [Flavobacterium sp.]
MKRFVIIIVLFINSIFAFSQKTPSFDINNLQINWELIANNYKNEEKVLTSFKFTNTGKTFFPASGWSIYFNYSRNTTPTPNSKDFIITHINGDISLLRPTSNFKGLKPNQSVDFSFLSNGKILNFTYAPAGLYIVWDANSDKGYSIKNYIMKPIVDSSVNYVTPEITYNNNKSIEDISIESLPKIFPSPKYFKQNSGNFILDNSVNIQSDSQFSSEANYLSNELSKILEGTIAVNSNANGAKQIILKKADLAKEEYILDIQSNKIEISASSGSGIFYGIQSLKSLLSADSWKKKSASITISNCIVKDEPRFEYRGLMFDVARNFQTKETIFKILDAMSLYKMNRFHFHFSDDEGWRIEISSLPELTKVGGKRGFTLDSKEFLPSSYGGSPETGVYPGSGYYSRQDFIEILKYATERHIQVIPEIESPGHSRAAIKAMDARYNKFMKLGNQQEAERYLLRDLNDKSVHSSAQLWTDNIMCVALPSTYTFMEKVFDDILEMYKEANAPIETIHLGGDEVPSGTWKLSPLCNKLIADDDKLNSTDDLWYYYFDKMEKIASNHNLTVSGWEEIAMRKTVLDGKKSYIPNPDFANKGFRAYVWNNGIGWGSEDLPYKLANSGYKVVLSCVSNLYFDLAYEKAPDELGYNWAGFNNIDKPFYFIPFDYYKNTKEDAEGNAIDSKLFNQKERLTDYGKSNILGIQGQLFSENVRSTQILEYLLYPKLLALAERSWAQNPAWATESDKKKSEILYNKDWSTFVNVLGKKEMPRLDYYLGGFGYRIPPVGAIIENGKVSANIQIPGFTIRYTTDGSEPTINSEIYKMPIATKGKITLCAFSSNGKKGKLTMVENK